MEIKVDQLLLWVLLGGLLGIIGQSIRVVVGIRKMSIRNELYEASRMFTSLVIGFVAGALGILNMYFQEEPKGMNWEKILLIITIGYSGVDFIEGFFRTRLSKKKGRVSVH